MGKELATRQAGGYLTNYDEFMDALASEARSLKGGGDGKAFMKFDGNSGDFSYGADDEPLDLGTKLAMNPRSYARGWVIWVDGDVVYENMVPLEEGAPPTKGSLPDHGPYGDDDGPVEQYTIDFKTLDEKGVEMVFQANNSSKRRALAALLKDFANTYKAHPGEVPIVEIDEREFETTGGKDSKSKRKYKKHAPVFKIVDWMPEEELLALSEGAVDDYEDEKPARSSRRSRDEDEDDRPARRTSRRDDPEEDDERPARRRASRDEEEQDERPARRTRRDEAEEQDEERPARRSRRDEPEEDEERPVRRSASRDADDGDDERPARRSASRDADDDAEERPARRSRRDADDGAEEPAPRRRGRF